MLHEPNCNAYTGGGKCNCSYSREDMKVSAGRSRSNKTMNYKEIIEQLRAPFEVLQNGPAMMPEMWRKWRCLRDAIHTLEELVKVEAEEQTKII